MTHHRTITQVFRDYPKEIILKDGNGVSLRPIRAGDESALFEMLNRLSEDDLWFLNYDVSEPRLIENWVADSESGRVISVVAILEGRMIANAVLKRKIYGAKSHIGKIRISVDPGFREKRLGTWMLLDLVNLAISIGVRMLVMLLVEGRDAAVIASVKKLDFTEEAVLKNYLLDRAGNPHDLVIMGKRLPSDWGDF